MLEDILGDLAPTFERLAAHVGARIVATDGPEESVIQEVSLSRTDAGEWRIEIQVASEGSGDRATASGGVASENRPAALGFDDLVPVAHQDRVRMAEGAPFAGEGGDPS